MTDRGRCYCTQNTLCSLSWLASVGLYNTMDCFRLLLCSLTDALFLLFLSLYFIHTSRQLLIYVRLFLVFLKYAGYKIQKNISLHVFFTYMQYLMEWPPVISGNNGTNLVLDLQCFWFTRPLQGHDTLVNRELPVYGYCICIF